MDGSTITMASRRRDHTEGGDFAREYRLRPRGHDKGLGSQVVHLGRLVVPEHPDKRGLVEQVGRHEGDLVDDVGYPFEGHGAAPTVSAHHVVALRKQ